jgi:hypothetical protein
LGHYSLRFEHAEALREWVPKCLNADQKRHVIGASHVGNIWNIFVGRNPNDFLSRLVTIEETWLYHYDPERKQ